MVLCEPGDEPRRGLARADALLYTAQNGEAAPGAPTRPTRMPPSRDPTPVASSPWEKPMSVPSSTYLYNTLKSDTPVVVPLPYFASSVSERPLSGPGLRGPFFELRVFAGLATTVSSFLCLLRGFWSPSPDLLMVRVFVSHFVFPGVLSFLCITRTYEWIGK